MAAPAPVERIITPQLSLAAPANHVLQHATFDDVEGLQSTEVQPTMNTFGSTHKLRLQELRCDKNNGIVKTTKLLVTNANFSAHYGDPDSYGDPLSTYSFESRSGAINCKTGGAYIGDGLRVGGAVGAPLFVNDQPNPIDPNTRIRTYVPSMNAPYIIKIFPIVVNEQTSVVDSLVEIGDHYKVVVDIPPDVYAVCQVEGGTPNIAVVITPYDNFGIAYHGVNFGLEDYQFLVRATRFGIYKCILYAERTDAIAKQNTYAEYYGTNRYFPIFGQDTAP